MNEEELNAITFAVTKALEARQDHCHHCPIPLEARRELGHIFGVVSDLGGGDIANGAILKGAEVIRANHKYVIKLQQVNNRIKDYITNAVIVTVVSAIGTILYLGFKAYTSNH